MKGAKYILTAAVIAMSSVMMTGCFKPSKDAVVESKYYQSLKDERDKLSVQLKEEKKKTNSLNKKIKAIHFWRSKDCRLQKPCQRQQDH